MNESMLIFQIITISLVSDLINFPINLVTSDIRALLINDFTF